MDDHDNSEKDLFDTSDQGEREQPDFYHPDDYNPQPPIGYAIEDRLPADYDRSAEANYYAEGDEGIPDISQVDPLQSNNQE